MTGSDSSNSEPIRQRTWLQKFRSAFRGLALGIKGPRVFESSFGSREKGAATNFKSPNSFWIHIPLAGAAVFAGVAFEVGLTSLAVLVACIGLVIVAELINTSIEFLASAVTSKYDQRVRAALDVASGAVLAASLVAVVVGWLVLWNGFYKWMN